MKFILKIKAANLSSSQVWDVYSFMALYLEKLLYLAPIFRTLLFHPTIQWETELHLHDLYIFREQQI